MTPNTLCKMPRKAVLKVFKNAKILMCYFHFKKNVKENCKHLMTKEDYSQLQCINEIFEQIVYYSTEFAAFERIPKFDRKTGGLADSIIKSNFKQIKIGLFIRALIKEKRLSIFSQ